MQVYAAVSIVDTTACFLIASLVADDFNACCFGHGLPVVELFLAWRGKAGVGQGEAELLVLGLTVAVVRQEFQLGAEVVLHEEVEDLGHDGVVGVDAEDGWYAHHQRQAVAVGAADILENQGIVHAGKAMMLARIDVLDVDKDGVHFAQGWRQLRVVKIAASFDGQRKSFVVKSVDHLRQEHRLRSGFAAGKGDAAAGMAEKNRLVAQFVENVVGLCPVGERVAAGLALRIGAPGAAQRAPRHKNDGANAFAVVDRKMLQLHDVAAHSKNSGNRSAPASSFVVVELRMLRARCGR